MKRSEELGLQLPVSFGLDTLAVQPNFVTRYVVLRLHALIVSSLLKLLSMVEVLPSNGYQLS